MTETLSPAELYQRIETLESRLAFQEDAMDTLDQALAEQSRRLEQLERLGELMRQRLREHQQRLPSNNETALPRAEDEIPPHY